MSTSTLDLVPPARRARGTLVLLTIAGLAALAFVWLAALPYFALNEARFGDYWPRRIPLLLHISGGIVAILSGPVQLWLGLTDQRPAVHRRLGYVYIGGVVLGGIAGYYMAATTTAGWAFGLGLAGLASAWFVTTALAVAAVKRSLLEQHKEWMIRSYVVTFAFVGFRVMDPALQSLHVGTPLEVLIVTAWGCWAIPLLITEAFIQGRKIFAVARTA